MMPAVLIAALLTTAAPVPHAARAYLRSSAASAQACRTTRVDDQLVSAGLFAKESEECPVARIGDEAIALRELAGLLESSHLARSPSTPAPAKRPEMDFVPALDRLINARLFVLEAREMQLDQAPELQAEVERFKASRLRTMLQESAARGVKPDAREVERLYRDAVREWKVSSVILDKEEDAKAFVAALKSGGSFEALAKKAGAEKKGRGDGKSQWVSRKHMLPEIFAAVQVAKQGVPVDSVKLSTGWVVLRVDATRYPKDPAARDAARAQSVARLEYEAVRRFYLDLVKRYAVVDEPLLEKLDLEAGGEQGFKALMNDQRVLATIRDEKPITVGDLSREVAVKFFHGIEQPIKDHKVNPQKKPAFEQLLGTRLLAREAAARKLAARPEYRREVAERERAILFATFVERVIVPGVEVADADARKHYEAHKAEYTAPQMYKLDGFAFTTGKDAQVALDKLKEGTDFTWLRTNAPGQVPPDRRSLQFDGRTVSVSTFQPGLAKVLAGARAGEYRLFAADEAEVYVIRVLDQIPPSTQPYEQARDEIVKKLYSAKVDGAIADYAAKLRKAQRVDVLITRVAM
jgi:parvulin-like peptidyl-prolyl isomerase